MDRRHETTASVISWAISELASAPAIQIMLREEIAELASATESSIIDRLPYLNAVCQEVLRLHPVVPLIYRKSIRDTTVAGHQIRAGTYVILAAESINKSDLHWGAEPTDFRPERWLHDTGDQMGALGGAASIYCNLTFLQGTKACIGKPLAMSEMKRMIATIIRRFEIRRAGSALPTANGPIATRPDGGLVVLLKPLPPFTDISVP